MNRLSGDGVSGGVKPSSCQRLREVVGAIVVIARVAERLVSPAVAGREQRVVDAARSILENGQDGPASIGNEGVADRSG